MAGENREKSNDVDNEKLRVSHNATREKELIDLLRGLIRTTAAIDFQGNVCLEFHARAGWIAKPITTVREIHDKAAS